MLRVGSIGNSPGIRGVSPEEGCLLLFTLAS